MFKVLKYTIVACGEVVWTNHITSSSKNIAQPIVKAVAQGKEVVIKTHEDTHNVNNDIAELLGYYPYD